MIVKEGFTCIRYDNANLDWIKWRVTNTIDETLNQWRDKHRVIDIVIE